MTLSEQMLRVMYTAIACGAVMACAPKAAEPAPKPEMVVDGSDYAFEVPDTLKAGLTTIRFRNVGKVPHEMVLALLKPGVTAEQLFEHMKAGGAPDSLLEGLGGILIAQPGATTIGALSIELQAGRVYIFACNFKDAADKPEHLMLGMVESRTVAAAP